MKKKRPDHEERHRIRLQELESRLPQRSLEEWARRLNDRADRLVESIIEQAIDIVGTKRDVQRELGRGAWKSWCMENARYTADYLDEWVKIALNPALCDKKNFPYLPPFVTNLARLSRAKPEQINQSLSTEKVHGEKKIWPSMTRMDADTFVACARAGVLTHKPLISCGDCEAFDDLLELQCYAEGTFKCLVIDPPWSFNNLVRKPDRPHRPDNFMGREMSYNPMSHEELLDLPVPHLAAKNCHLWLWVTKSSLFLGGELMEHWGFRYVSIITWFKDRANRGYHFNGRTEFCLFGIKGSLPIMDDTLSDYIYAEEPPYVEAPRGDHSSKPREFYDIIERASPAPRLDMFARGPWIGNSIFGNQIPDLGRFRSVDHAQLLKDLGDGFGVYVDGMGKFIAPLREIDVIKLSRTGS